MIPTQRCVALRHASAEDAKAVEHLLTERALQEAEVAGARDVYLLTTTAEQYFPPVGFACIVRDAVPDAVTASVEFRSACPASAVVMHRALGATREAAR
jgi:N-acetylglutamate synthase-like GNAT family acetyltransferase